MKKLFFSVAMLAAGVAFYSQEAKSQAQIGEVKSCYWSDTDCCKASSGSAYCPVCEGC